MIERIFDAFDFLLDHIGKVAAVLVLVAIIATTVSYYQTDTIREACMIEDKESINTGDGHEYRVYTDCGNFVVQDEFLAGNFVASDTYRDLQENHAYDLRTRGWRIPFLSWFPNIYAAYPTGETAK